MDVANETPFPYENLVVDIPDYPEPGVVFKDITPLIADERGFSACVDAMTQHFLGKGVTKVVGSEARGFLIGTPVAYRLGAGFVPARKPGKLPREVYTQSYALEYGTDELQIHKDALSPDDRVIIVDDLVATAGTALPRQSSSSSRGRRSSASPSSSSSPSSIRARPSARSTRRRSTP